jgi:hypothetical protein
MLRANFGNSLVATPTNLFAAKIDLATRNSRRDANHMNTRLVALAVMLLALSSGLAATQSFGQETKSPKVLIIGVDGLRTDALHAANAPHLDSLVKQGAFADNTQIVSDRYLRSDTVSGPGWSSILTGTWANKHGVHDHTFRGANYEHFPHFFARLKEVRPTAQTASFVTWPPIAEKIVSQADVNELVQVEGTSANLYLQAEREVSEKASSHLRDETADATFVYFGLVDSLGHTKGFHPNVAEYIQAIELVDICVGELISAITARKTFDVEDWLILVATDHGGRGRNHQDGQRVPEIRTVFLIVSGPSAVQGKIDEATSIVDVVPTALKHLGVSLDEKWKLDGRAVGLQKPK